MLFQEGGREQSPRKAVALAWSFYKTHPALIIPLIIQIPFLVYSNYLIENYISYYAASISLLAAIAVVFSYSWFISAITRQKLFDSLPDTIVDFPRKLLIALMISVCSYILYAFGSAAVNFSSAIVAGLSIGSITAIIGKVAYLILILLIAIAYIIFILISLHFFLFSFSRQSLKDSLMQSARRCMGFRSITDMMGIWSLAYIIPLVIIIAISIMQGFFDSTLLLKAGFWHYALDYAMKQSIFIFASGHFFIALLYYNGGMIR